MTLEEQRLENGVLNGFYTEVDQAVTGADGVVELTTVRSNVLSIRLRVRGVELGADQPRTSWRTLNTTKSPSY